MSRVLSRLRRAWRPGLRQLAGLLTLLAVVVTVTQLWQTRSLAARLPLQTQLELVDAQGRRTTLSLQDWISRQSDPVVALYVWADWCPICRAQEGTARAVAADHPTLSVAWRSGDPQAVARHLRQRRLDWPTVVDADGDLAQRLGVQAVPTWVVLDRQGAVHTPSVGWTSPWGLRLRLAWARWVAPSAGS